MNKLVSHNTYNNTPPPRHIPVAIKLKGAYGVWCVFNQNLPKTFRLSLGAKIDSLFLEELELVFIATYTKTEEKLGIVTKAILKIDLIKFFLQTAQEAKSLDNKKHAVLSNLISEIGKDLTKWKKYLEDPSTILRVNKTPAKKSSAGENK